MTVGTQTIEVLQREDHTLSHQARDWRLDGYLLLFTFLVNFLRGPHALLRGRVIAEEGGTYFRYAWEAAPGHALIALHQGYFSLFPNVVGLIAARIVPLADVGLFCTWSSLAVQLWTVWLLLSSGLFVGRRPKVLATLVLVLAPPNGDLWLASMTSQFNFAMCVVLVLLSENETRPHYGSLLVGGLTSPLACLLAPWFWLRAAMERKPAAYVKAVVITLCLCLQVVVVLLRGKTGVHHNLARLIKAAADKNVLLPFGSAVPARAFFYWALAHPGASLSVALILLGVFAMGLWALVLFAGQPALRFVGIGIWLEGCALWCGLDHGVLMIHPHVDGRYFVQTNICVGFALVACWSKARGPIRQICVCLLGALLLSGTVDLYLVRKASYPDPDWRTQVAAWKRDARTPIRIGPGGWPPIYLSPAHPNLNLPSSIYDSVRQ